MASETRKAYEQALDALEPTIRRAFLAAVGNLRSNSQVRLVQEAVTRGDWQAALDILRLDEGLFFPLDQSITNAFYQGGIWQLSHLGAGGVAASFSFQGRHRRAEAWIASNVGGFIRDITNEQVNTVREIIQQGVIDGRNPRPTALDLVGRIADGARKGGVIGLNNRQAGWVQNLRSELSDPEQMANYFNRKARDKRFDRTVRRALDEGRPVASADIERIATRYADRLLFLRGETIAQTETLSAFNAGRHEAIEQLIEAGDITRDQVKVRWSATLDAMTRDAHVSLNNTVVDFGEAFLSPTGNRLRYPGDTSLGAGGEDVIRCRCMAQHDINWLAGAV